MTAWPQSGWYVDPETRRERYWDGTAWGDALPTGRITTPQLSDAPVSDAERAPGWYPDPATGKMYQWDGQRWEGTGHGSTLEIIGWIGAAFFAILGLVIGLILLGDPERRTRASWMIVVSALSLWIWYSLFPWWA